MRLIVGGGRASEGPDSRGAVVVGVRTLSEGGRVGNFSREQVYIVALLYVYACFVLERRLSKIFLRIIFYFGIVVLVASVGHW